MGQGEGGRQVKGTGEACWDMVRWACQGEVEDR